jgi:formylglycine-generating enzyme required for sulfatase activity
MATPTSASISPPLCGGSVAGGRSTAGTPAERGANGRIRPSPLARAVAVALLSLVGAAPTTAPVTLSLDLGKGLTLELVRVPAGKFVMGSPPAEEERDDSEGPQHTVTIGKPFWIGKFEVTQAQWVGAGFANQSQFQAVPGHEALPCECVSWTDCQKFCDAAGKLTGRHLRLPSEAEWEYAARGGGTGVFGSAGDKLASTAANFNGNSPYGGAPAGPERQHPTPVGSFPANGFGLCDTVGNVSEWCQDVYHDSYAGAPTDGSAWVTGGEKPDLRVYRGGAYNNDASSCRSAVRYAAEQGDVRNSTLGFRVVADDGAGGK